MNRKTGFLLALSLFAAAFRTPASADSPLQVDCRNFTRILSQLEVGVEKVYGDFVSAQAVPADETRMIWVIPTIRSETDGQPSELGCYVLLADTEKGRIISSCYDPQAWNSDSGAYRLLGIEIDTLGYRLHSEGLSFGVRLNQRIGSRASHYDESSLNLFVCGGDSLQSVFRYTESECQTDEYADSEWRHVQNSRWLLPLAGVSDDFYDFALLTRQEFLTNDLLDSASLRIAPPQVFIRAGDDYKETECSPDGSYRAGRIESDGNFRGNCYYFGKSMADIYPLIRDERNAGGLDILRPDLPVESACCSVSNDGNELDIDYEYLTPEHLVIGIRPPRKAPDEVCDRSRTEFYILQQTEEYTMTGHGFYTLISTIIDP